MRLGEDDLIRWGERVGATIRPPVVVALKGPLGAGKSVLARAIGRGAGVEGPMPSPTFNLMLRYPTPSGAEVVHLDLYRIGGPHELWEMGWSELGAAQEIVLVEWPERAVDLLPSDYWLIELSVPRAQRQLRDVEVRRVGDPAGGLPGFPMSLSGRR